MFEIHPPLLKKYQNIAGIAGCIGFILGTVIPGICFLMLGWHCPFGSGILRIGVFLIISGFASAIVLGNLVALLLIGSSKYRQILSDFSKKEK
ncbi:MAG: hypothetical protein OXU23_24020 [Candidatus Poribacteria bacterium]|nr:hypothetical protein [Candidatus Poribacteria bacterium]